MRPYRESPWEPIASAPTRLALETWAQDYQRSGYETELRAEHGTIRLYVRKTV